MKFSDTDLLNDLAQARAERDAALAELDRAEDQANNIAADLIVAEAERDEARAQVSRVRALAESWRYKGEFDWGPWQEGYGPDQEGHVLDGASADIRIALDGIS